MRPLNIVIGDDHEVVIAGLKSILHEQYKVVGTAGTGRELVEMATRLRPDVVILDFSMPELNGLEAARLIRQLVPATRLVFLTMHANALYARTALDAGGQAYVLKTGAVEEINTAIAYVASGGIYVSPALRGEVFAGIDNFGNSQSRGARALTSRQIQVLQLISEGRSSREIAILLNISMKTVEFHRARLIKALGTRSTPESVRLGVEQGLIQSGGPIPVRH